MPVWYSVIRSLYNHREETLETIAERNGIVRVCRMVEVTGGIEVTFAYVMPFMTAAEPRRRWGVGTTEGDTDLGLATTPEDALQLAETALGETAAPPTTDVQASPSAR